MGDGVHLDGHPEAGPFPQGGPGFLRGELGVTLVDLEVGEGGEVSPQVKVPRLSVGEVQSLAWDGEPQGDILLQVWPDELSDELSDEMGLSSLISSGVLLSGIRNCSVEPSTSSSLLFKDSLFPSLVVFSSSPAVPL